MTTPMAPVMAPMAAMKNRTALMSSFAFGPQRSALDRHLEQHLLGEDQIGPRVVRQLIVVAHRDGIERAGDLAVAAEDAAAEVDLVDGGIALAGRHPILRRVLRGDDADAVGRASGGPKRAAGALPP